MAGTTYQELLEGVAQYYGSGSDQWASIARYGVNAETIPILEQVPGVSITRSNSGAFLGYNYNNPFAGTGNPSSIINSNTQTGAYGQGAFNAQLPATAVTNPTTGVTTMQSGARVTATGNTVASIADRASLAVAGVALGTKMGKLIDSALYSVNPQWWDANYPSINPETWDDIATTQGGKNFIRSIFGLQNDDTTMYLDERMLAYTYMMLLQNGAWGDSGKTIVVNNPNVTKNGTTYTLISTPKLVTPAFLARYNGESEATIHSATGNFEICYAIGQSSGVRFYFASTHDFTVTSSINSRANSPTTLQTTREEFISGYPIYHATHLGYYSNYRDGSTVIPAQVQFSGSSNADIISPNNALAIFHILLYQSTITDNPTIPGVSENPQAGTQINPTTIINPTTGQPVTPNDNPADVLQALRTQYPDLFTDAIYEDVPQPDGTTQRITYIPVPYPNTVDTPTATATPEQPITDTTPGIDPQTDPQINPSTRIEPLIQQLIDTITTDPTPPDTGEGNTPTVVIPSGSANALYAIYNPTQGELSSFGSWLWSSNFVDQLLKLFNDPMQAIIGLHKVFAPPAISGTSTIKVGYLDSGVSSNVVGNQYTTIDCGSVSISEYFGNVFDYDPFTQIYIYLPFVGIERLDVGEVMRGSVGVKYHVDVLTGACLAEITVIRDGAGGILYTFAGNCAVQYPVSSGSYMGIVASLASIAGGVVGTIASGGALAPVAMGAVSGIMNAHTRVNHSGAFSGNAGAMGVKTPYIIITRPQTCLADNFPAFNGYPANKTTTLSACSGFVKCETCHVENIPATDTELSEIEMLLKAGVLI